MKVIFYQFIFFSVLITFIQCDNFCNVYDIQEITELKGDNSIIAWTTICGATGHNHICVTWKKKNMNLKGKRGEIFEAKDGDNIKIVKISNDTVKIYYFALDVQVKKENKRGITFLYEGKKPEFFEQKSTS